RFTDNEVVYYKVGSNNDEIKLRSEQLRFLPYDSLKYDFSATRIIFSNSEVWTFWLSRKTRQQELSLKIYTDSIDNSKILFEERRIIIDKKERKKALQKEIYTYYKKK